MTESKRPLFDEEGNLIIRDPELLKPVNKPMRQRRRRRRNEESD